MPRRAMDLRKLTRKRNLVTGIRVAITTDSRHSAE
jgi:hypothetical protein